MLITREQARFILAACSADKVREHLHYPHVSEVRGKLWICATDGHRLHAVVAPPDLPVGYCVVDKNGTVFSAPRDMKFPLVEHMWTDENDARAVKVEVARLEALTSTRHPKMLVKFGAGVEARDPRPHFADDGAPDSCACAWAKYVGDAILAVPGGKRAPAHVLVARGRDGLDPIIMMEGAPVPSWRAVVMPVRVKP